MALEQKKKLKMQNDLNTIVTRTENRYPYRLSDDNPEMSEEQKSLHKVSDAEKENLKIQNLLNNAKELNIPDDQQADLKIKHNRNMNFLFVNQEKWFGDSQIMSNLKDNVTGYEHYLSAEITATQNGDKKVDRVRRAALAIQFCDKILNGCDAYLARGRSFFIWRWKRYESVQLLKIRMQKEREILEQIKDERFDKKYGSVAKDEKNLSALLNVNAVHGKLMNRRTERINTLKTKLDNAEKPMAVKRDAARQKIEKKLGLQKGEVDRTTMEVATTLQLAEGCSADEAAEVYENLRKNMSACTPQEKKERVQSMEKIFKAILDFDLNQFNIKSLEDLYGEKFEKCRSMTLLGHDCDVIIQEYKELLKGNDRELAKLSDKKFAEVVARRETLEALANIYSELKKILNAQTEKPLDLDGLMNLSASGIQEAMSNASDPMMVINVYAPLMTIKTQLSDPDTGKLLFGAGIDVNNLLHNEMLKQGVVLYDIDEDLRKNKEKHAEDNNALDEKNKQFALNAKAKQKKTVERDEKKLTEKEKKEKKEKIKKSAEEFREKQLERDKKENAAGEKAYNEKMSRLKDTLGRLLNKENLTEAEKQELKKAQSQVALEVHNRQTDQKVYARNYVDMSIKKKVTYQVMQELSAFYPMMEGMFGERSKEKFKELVEKYASADSRQEAMSEIQEYLEQIGASFDPKELLSDKLSLNMDKYEKMSGMVEAMKRLLKLNPDYKTNVSFDVTYKRLCVASDYYRVKKQIMLDPSYSLNPPVDLKSYPQQRENFAKSHMRRMLMVEKVLAHNLSKACGLESDILSMNAIADNPFEEADRLYAIRLSNDENLSKAADLGKKVQYKKLALKYEKIVAERDELEKQLRNARGQEKDTLLTQIREKNALCQEISRKAKSEFAQSAEGRIEDAIRLIEQERFRVPMDFNIVDLNKIPKERNDVEMGLKALLENPNLKNLDNHGAISDKMGYGALREWYDDYKVKYLKKPKQVGNIRGHESGSIPSQIIFNDIYDRIAHHFFGSYHFHRTDAEMREQIEALTFASTNMATTLDEDPEAIAYMDSMFGEMNMRMHNQIADAFWRNLYGGVYKLALMTHEDRHMALNVYQKMDISAAAIASNVTYDTSLGYYYDFMLQGDAHNHGLLDDEGLKAGAHFMYLMNGVFMLNCLGVKNTSFLSPEMKDVYNKFVEKYKRDNPGSGDEEAGNAFLIAHPEAWNNKKVYSAKLSANDSEERNETYLNKFEAMWCQYDLLKVFNMEQNIKLTPQELEQYKEQIKDQGYEGYDKFLDAINGGSDIETVDQRLKAIKIKK